MIQSRNVFGPMFILPSAAVCLLSALVSAPAFGQTAPADPAIPAAGKDVVNVDDYGTVDIAVQDTDLAQVLQMLAIHSKKNIITSKNVSATVTANLYQVTFREALDAILHVNGFDWVEEGNFIYVYTIEELREREITMRQRESRIFILDHLSSVDASEFIQPLLSDVGQASARGEVEPGMKPDVTDAGADSYAFTSVLVVNDYTENLTAIAALLQELDTPPQQVLVEATVLQASVDETNAFGVDFSVIGSLNFADLTNPLSAVTNLLEGNEDGPDVKADAEQGFQPGDNSAAAGSSTVGNTAGPGGLKVGVISDDISVFLRVLDQVSDNTVLARPRIMALNRQRAEVLVGARVGYLSTTATETTTTQTVEFLDTGIQLIFRPFISKDGTIRMELKPSVSEARLRNVTDSNGALVTIPDELTNELTTNVRVRDGETLVLGGLFKENIRKERRQVPFLGDVPVLGAAFKGQDDTISRSEIIFLITPTVIKDDLLWKAGQAGLDMVETARVGMRGGLLPWSQESVTANHNQDASKAIAEGDTKKALYHLDTSLSLNPNQPEIIRLRDDLSRQEPSRVHERSLMQRLLDKEVYGKPVSAKEPVSPEPVAVDPLAAPATTASSETSVAEQPEAAQPGSYQTSQEEAHTTGVLETIATAESSATTEGAVEAFETDARTASASDDHADSFDPGAIAPEAEPTFEASNPEAAFADEATSSDETESEFSDEASDMEPVIEPTQNLTSVIWTPEESFAAASSMPAWQRFWFFVAMGQPLDNLFVTTPQDASVASVDPNADATTEE
jgi:type IV pilus assembly protein PilQ